MAVVALVSTPGTLELDAADPTTSAGLLESTTFDFAQIEVVVMAMPS